MFKVINLLVHGEQCLYSVIERKALDCKLLPEVLFLHTEVFMSNLVFSLLKD